MDVTKHIDSLTEQIKDYVHGAGKKGVVIGLSGGVDSAVSFELAIRALGKENVIAVSIPILANTDEEFGSSSEMWSYAFEKRGVRHITVQGTIPALSIFDATTSALNQIGIINASSKPSLTYPNVQARTRMAILYDVAGELDYLVIGTGNKSEHKIGYFTKWGDGAVDFEPLGAYYKDEVYELAHELGVPKSIIDRPPSAGLWKGQTDEDELGVTYAVLDSYLRWAELSDNWKEQIACPIGGEKRNRIESLMKASGHKNKLPPVFRRIDD